MKCNQPCPGFELVSPCTFPTMITIRSQALTYIYKNADYVNTKYIHKDILYFNVYAIVEELMFPGEQNSLQYDIIYFHSQRKVHKSFSIILSSAFFHLLIVFIV